MVINKRKWRSNETSAVGKFCVYVTFSGMVSETMILSQVCRDLKRIRDKKDKKLNHLLISTLLNSNVYIYIHISSMVYLIPRLSKSQHLFIYWLLVAAKSPTESVTHVPIGIVGVQVFYGIRRPSTARRSYQWPTQIFWWQALQLMVNWWFGSRWFGIPRIPENGKGIRILRCIPSLETLHWKKRSRGCSSEWRLKSTSDGVFPSVKLELIKGIHLEDHPSGYQPWWS